MTAKGPIFPTHSVNLHVKTTASTAIDLPCLVCPDTDEKLMSVLDCSQQNKAIMFDH